MQPKPTTNWAYEQPNLNNTHVWSLQFAVIIDDEIERLLNSSPYFSSHKGLGHSADTALLFINKCYKPIDVLTWLDDELASLFARRQPPDELNDDDRSAPDDAPKGGNE